MQGLRAVPVPVAGEPVSPRHSSTVDLTSYAAVSVQSVPTQAAEKRWDGLKRGPDDYNVGDDECETVSRKFGQTSGRYPLLLCVQRKTRDNKQLT